MTAFFVVFLPVIVAFGAAIVRALIHDYEESNR